MTKSVPSALRVVVVGTGGLAAGAAWTAWFLWQEPEQISRGRRLYAQHCASCHGAKLEGQANWQEPLPNGRMPAPPHDATGHTWHHSDRELLLITKKGMAAIVPGYQSDMPAFDGVLSDPDIEAVLAFIKENWPREARRHQADRTIAEDRRSGM